MFKKLGNLNVIFTAIVLVSAFVLIANVISGQASTNTGGQIKGAGVVNLNSGEVSIADYGLMESDPTRIKSIRLEVYDERIDESANILVTADGGDNWASCKWVEGTTWMCSYPEQKAPQIADIYSIEVIVKG